MQKQESEYPESVGVSRLISWFLVNEYVDIAKDRSSLRLDNLLTSKASIFYHRHRGIDKQSALTEYEIEKNVCKSVSLFEWPLAKIRNFVVRMLPYVKLVKEVSDIALGPSALLLAVEESLDDFRYSGTSFNTKRLTNMDIYTYLANFNESKKRVNIQSEKMVLVKVKIPTSSGKGSKRKAQTLAELARTDSKADIFALEICELARNSISSKQLFDKEYLCTNSEFIVHINYYILAEMTSGTLIGDSLDGDQVFNFNQSPFMQPIGIGCWHDEANYQDFKRFNSPSLKFSAEYITTNGISNGLSYVAFDGYRQILRLDRQGRKSIYDLESGNSYNTFEFKAIKELTDEPDYAKNCIVLQSDFVNLEKGNFMLERLLGIGLENGGTSAYYLGSRVIDHVLYEVYEAELLYDRPSGLEGYNLPILMEPSRFTMPLNKQSGKNGSRFFMTYYLIELTNNFEGTILVPKFIELWRLSRNGKGNEKTLVNRLQFDEFNWDLDVEPSGDPDSQDLSRVFNIENCVKDRASQLQVRFRIIQEAKGEVKGEVLEQFKENTHLIKEIIHERLSTIMEVSLVNIARVDVSFIRQTPNLLVESRIVSLNSGISVDSILGYAKFLDILQALKQSIIIVFQNRHSLEACRLDSLSVNERNNLMFCRGLTLCVLFKENAMNNYHVLDQVGKSELIYSSNPSDAMCEVHRFIWALKPKLGNSNSIWSRHTENVYKLSRSSFEIPFVYLDKKQTDSQEKLAVDSDGELVKITYKGLGYAPETKTIDPIGFSGFGATLNGLRYTTMLEEPSAQNLNYGILMSLINLKEDKFEYCHRACELDDYCESYSVCIGKKSLKVFQNDCVLSTLRVKSDILSQIEEKNLNKEDNFEIKGTSYYESQVFRFRREPDCSIYQKDTLASYKIYVYFEIQATTSEEKKRNGDKGEQQQQQVALIEGQYMSQSECADSAYELSVWSKSTYSNFIYCPLSSLCFVGAKKRKELSRENVEFDQVCYGYAKTHLQFFNQYRMTRLAINLRSINGSGGSSETGAPVSTTSIKPTIKDEIRADMKEFEELEIGRVIEGLDTEQCARDCNLLESKCLAFDACRVSSDQTFCILYSIRSPMSSMKKRFGFLKQEKRFYEEKETTGDTVNVIGDSMCNHYDLKNVYFDIRMHQMLDKDGTNSHDKMDEIESTIIRQDQKRSEEIFNTLDDLPSSSSKINDADKNNQQSGGIHWLALVMGIILGIVGALYGKEGTQYAVEMFSSYRSGRPSNLSRNGRRISQVELANDEQA